MFVTFSRRHDSMDLSEIQKGSKIEELILKLINGCTYNASGATKTCN